MATSFRVSDYHSWNDSTNLIHFNLLLDDCNRVVLSSYHQDGDYINASYINIPLPGNNKTLRYIATQGNILYNQRNFIDSNVFVSY